MNGPLVFICYSRKDERWKDRLVSHLSFLERQGLLEIWNDSRIHAGEDWKAGIDSALNSAKAAVLLVSADFLTSDFIQTVELPRLLERRAKEGLVAFPVIVFPCLWKYVPKLDRLLVRPKDGRPLSRGNKEKQERELSIIAAEVMELLKGMTDTTVGGEPLVEQSRESLLNVLGEGSFSTSDCKQLETHPMDEQLDDHAGLLPMLPKEIIPEAVMEVDRLFHETAAAVDRKAAAFSLKRTRLRELQKERAKMQWLLDGNESQLVQDFTELYEAETEVFTQTIL